MKVSIRSIPIWAVIPAALTVETVLCSVLAAAALDSLVRRPQQGGGSITTLLPGFVYACATVMKVCVVSVVLSAVIGLAWRLLFARNASRNPSPALPVWGTASIALFPLTPFLGTLVVLVTQNLTAAPVALSASHFSQVARSGVFVMLAILLAGVFASLTSLIRRERPALFPVLGLIANTILVGLFWYLRFHALGFDQDLWAPR
jgi:hypothetical protein